MELVGPSGVSLSASSSRAVNGADRVASHRRAATTKGCMGRLTAAALMMVALTAAPVAADPITITAGTIGVVNGLDLPGFTLTGEGALFNGIVVVGGEICCSFAAGDLFALQRTFPLGTLPLQPTTQIVDGTRYPFAFIGGELMFSTAPVTVQHPSGLFFSFTTPFTATGEIAGFADAGHTIPLFTADVTGTGTATVSGRGIGDDSLIGTALSFAFAPSSPAATPEPASAVLMGTGLVGLAAYRRIRRWRSGRRLR